MFKETYRDQVYSLIRYTLDRWQFNHPLIVRKSLTYLAKIPGK